MRGSFPAADCTKEGLGQERPIKEGKEKLVTSSLVKNSSCIDFKRPRENNTLSEHALQLVVLLKGISLYFALAKYAIK